MLTQHRPGPPLPRENHGTLEARSWLFPTFPPPPLFQVPVGTLRVEGGVSGTGIFPAVAGATLEFTGGESGRLQTFDAGSQIIGAGTVHFAGDADPITVDVPSR